MHVWRLSVAYIGPKSRTERPRQTKIGTEVAHVTYDSDTTFRVKRSKVNWQGAGYMWRPTAHIILTVECALGSNCKGRITNPICYCYLNTLRNCPVTCFNLVFHVMYIGISEKLGNLGLPYIFIVDFILGFILPNFQKSRLPRIRALLTHSCAAAFERR